MCCDAGQEWIGSLARRGISLLHLVDEEDSGLKDVDHAPQGAQVPRVPSWSQPAHPAWTQCRSFGMESEPLLEPVTATKDLAKLRTATFPLDVMRPGTRLWVLLKVEAP